MLAVQTISVWNSKKNQTWPKSIKLVELEIQIRLNIHPFIGIKRESLSSDSSLVTCDFNFPEQTKKSSDKGFPDQIRKKHKSSWLTRGPRVVATDSSIFVRYRILIDREIWPVDTLAHCQRLNMSRSHTHYHALKTWYWNFAPMITIKSLNSSSTWFLILFFSALT